MGHLHRFLFFSFLLISLLRDCHTSYLKAHLPYSVPSDEVHVESAMGVVNGMNGNWYCLGQEFSGLFSTDFLMGSPSPCPVLRARAKFTYQISISIAYTSAQEPLHSISNVLESELAIHLHRLSQIRHRYDLRCIRDSCFHLGRPLHSHTLPCFVHVSRGHGNMYIQLHEGVTV